MAINLQVTLLAKYRLGSIPPLDLSIYLRQKETTFPFSSPFSQRSQWPETAQGEARNQELDSGFLCERQELATQAIHVLPQQVYTAGGWCPDASRSTQQTAGVQNHSLEVNSGIPVWNTDRRQFQNLSQQADCIFPDFFLTHQL